VAIGPRLSAAQALCLHGKSANFKGKGRKVKEMKVRVFYRAI